MCKSPTKSDWSSPSLACSLLQVPQGTAQGQAWKSCIFFAGSVPAVHSDPPHSLGEGLPGLSQLWLLVWVHQVLMVL